MSAQVGHNNPGIVWSVMSLITSFVLNTKFVHYSLNVYHIFGQLHCLDWFPLILWLNEIPMSFHKWCGMRMCVSDKTCTVDVLNAYVHLYQLLDLILLLRFLDPDLVIYYISFLVPCHTYNVLSLLNKNVDHNSCKQHYFIHGTLLSGWHWLLKNSLNI